MSYSIIGKTSSFGEEFPRSSRGNSVIKHKKLKKIIEYIIILYYYIIIRKHNSIG